MTHGAGTSYLGGLAISACICMSGCGGTGDRVFEERLDSAGVAIVSWTGEDRDLDWQFKELFTLGGSEGRPDSFYRVSPTDVGADSAGNIYILEHAASRVVVFDSAGEFVREMGGEGSGPGELPGPASMWVSRDGTVSVFDYLKGGLVLYGSDGAVLSERPFRLFAVPTGHRHFAASSEGIFVVTQAPREEEDRTFYVLLNVTSEDTTELAAVEIPPSEMVWFPECGVGLRLPPLFNPVIAWEVRDSTIAVAASSQYSVDMVRNNAVVLSVRRAMEPQSASRELALAEVGEGMRVGSSRGRCMIEAEELVDARGFSDVVPIIGRVALSRNGELWVKRRVPGDDEAGAIDVFGVDGSYVGTLPGNTPFPVVFLPRGRVGVVETDELEVERLVVMELVR